MADAPVNVSHAAVVALYTRMLDAWNRRDADAFAAPFTSTATVVGFDGSQMTGRGEIASELRTIFANHQTAAYVAKIREIRHVHPAIAILRAVVGMVPPGETELNPGVNSIQCAVIVADAGELRFALLQNTPAAFHGRPHLAEGLTSELTAVLRSGSVVVA